MMTKIELGKLIQQARESSGRGKHSFLRQACITFTQITQMENGLANYGFKKLLDFLFDIGYKLYIIKQDDKYCIDSGILLSKVLKLLRQEKQLRIDDIASSNISHSTISNIENNKVNASIDSVLYLLDKYDATMQLERA